MTGSFDKTVKIWSTDGKLVHKLEGFQGNVTGVCYVPRNKTIWAAGGSPYAYLYDPKSGDNVSNKDVIDIHEVDHSTSILYRYSHRNSSEDINIFPSSDLIISVTQ